MAYPEILAVIDDKSTAANWLEPNLPTEKTDATVKEYCKRKVMIKGTEYLNNTLVSVSISQVTGHVSGTVVSTFTEGLEVQSGTDDFDESEWQHSWDPTLGHFQSEGASVHGELLNMASAQVVAVTGQVDFWFKRVRVSSFFVTSQDGEVVVGKVNTSVTIKSNGSSKKDQVLRDRCVQDEHGTHRTTGIVVGPLVPVQVVDDVTVDSLDSWGQVDHDGGSVSVWVVF